jgi:hypothetical protein
MNWRLRAIGFAIGFALVSVPVAHADIGMLGNVERFHAEMQGHVGSVSCDEQFRSYESRQLRLSERRHLRAECERLVREAAEAHAKSRIADTAGHTSVPAPR